MDDLNCKSCTIYEDRKHLRTNNNRCEILDTGNIGKCPCTSCIIKMTCRVSCEEFVVLMILCQTLYTQMLREREEE